ncbi:MAG TPA: CoA ester lyase [Hyphomicrobiaceae bacterium]
MRSKLFVPGSRPELFEKAIASGADAVAFDLEDAVVPERKAQARAVVASFLAERRAGAPLLIVRINPIGSPYFQKDIEALVLPGLDVLNLPKIESGDEVRDVSTLIADLETQRGLQHRIGILANIETPRAVRLAAEIATSDRRLVGLQLGFGDLFEPFGIDRSDPVAAAAVKLSVRLAAAEGNLPLYDSAFPAVEDMAGFRAEAESARRLGLAGKSCIHPSQVATANEVFFPTAKEIDVAKQIVAAADEKFSQGIGAFMLNGVMVDEPYVARARALLAIAAGGAS